MNFLRGLPTALGIVTVGLSGYSAILVTRDSEIQRETLAKVHEKVDDESRQTRLLIQRVHTQHEEHAATLTGLPEKVDLIKRNAEIDSNVLIAFTLGTFVVSTGGVMVSLLRN